MTRRHPAPPRALLALLTSLALAVGLLAAGPMSPATASVAPTGAVEAVAAPTGIVKTADLSKFRPGHDHLRLGVLQLVHDGRGPDRLVPAPEGVALPVGLHLSQGLPPGHLQPRRRQLLRRVLGRGLRVGRAHHLEGGTGMRHQPAGAARHAREGAGPRHAHVAVGLARTRSRWARDAPTRPPATPRYYGFYNQMYGAARQIKIYTENRYFTYYAPGKTWNIRYSPNAACGSSPGVHREPGHVEPLLLHAVPAERCGAARRLRRGRRLLRLRQPQLLPATSPTGSAAPRCSSEQD